MQFLTFARLRVTALCFCSVFGLVACGGGGGGSSSADTSTLSTTVIDGAIENATVCLDKNNNGVCDAGEPASKTNAAGKANLTVAKSDVGKYPLLVVVDTDAKDADTGEVTTRYTMKAPADQTAVVSPLTTLVQSEIEGGAASTAAAVESVKNKTGLAISPLSDFTKDPSNADQKSAQILANAIVVTTQEQTKKIADAVGSKSLVDGSTITRSDLDKLVQQKVTELLPQIVSASTDSTVQSATDAKARVRVLADKANTILADGGIASASGAVASIDVGKQTDKTQTSTTPTASASLSSFYFLNLQSYFAKISSSTSAQNTPDSNNLVRYRWNYLQASPSFSSNNLSEAALSVWGTGSAPQRGGDLHWNGSIWRTCPINFENTQSVRDAAGNSNYNFCDSRETGSGSRNVVDISNKSMADFYQSVRDQGYTNITIGTTDKPASTWLAGGTFPDGSVASFITTKVSQTAITYYPGTGNYVYLQDTAYAAGDSAACKTGPNASETATLELLVAVSKGTPCSNAEETIAGINGTQISSGTKNEGWGVTTLSLGTIGNAQTTSESMASSYYTGNSKLRVAFGAKNSTKYYECQERYNGGTMNCTEIGTGTYAIQSLGDKRVMTFANLPQRASALDFVRVFVESDGHVFLGYQSRVATYRTARFNLPALNAVSSKLGLSQFDPTQALALNALSYQGSYGGTWGSAAGQTYGTFNFSLSATGTFSCSGTDKSAVPPSTFNCTVTVFGPNAKDTTMAGFEAVTTGTLKTTLIGSINYYTGTVTGTWSNSNGGGTLTGKRI
jgi:hypothetical protein